MAKTEYRVFKKGNKVPEKTIERPEMLDRVEVFLRKADDAKTWYRHREAPDKWSPELATYKRVVSLTRAAKDGWRVCGDPY